jgi:hypothetical protein
MISIDFKNDINHIIILLYLFFLLEIIFCLAFLAKYIHKYLSPVCAGQAAARRPQR